MKWSIIPAFPCMIWRAPIDNGIFENNLRRLNVAYLTLSFKLFRFLTAILVIDCLQFSVSSQIKQFHSKVHSETNLRIAREK